MIAQIQLLTPEKMATFFHQAVIEPQGLTLLSQISGSQHEKAEYAKQEGFTNWQEVSKLQQSFPVKSDNP